jgi:cellular nucleic acid-binding protein
MNSARKGCFKCGNCTSLGSLSFSCAGSVLTINMSLIVPIVGHHADSCTATERLCYNCRQPGHESAACPSPRSVSAKQCYSCGGVGHIQADCPTLRIQSMNAGGVQNQKCYVSLSLISSEGNTNDVQQHCGRPGHISRFCPAATGGPLSARIGPRAPPQGSAPVKCFRCGGLNHYSRYVLFVAKYSFSFDYCAGTAWPQLVRPFEGQQVVQNTGSSNNKSKTCYKCHREGHVSIRLSSSSLSYI